MANKKLIVSVGAPITGGGGGGAVDSVFGRTGDVVAENGDYSTSQVSESTDKNYVTDAEKSVLSNTSGTNTGDETTSSIQTKRPLKTVGGQSLEGTGDISLPESAEWGNITGTLSAQTDLQAALNSKLESIPNATYNVVGGVKMSRDSADSASSTTYISFDGTDTPNVT
jgi:hypothetical protein